MNRKLLFKQLYFICFLCLFTACNEDDDNKKNEFSSELTGTYTNRMGAHEGSDSLILNYNGIDFRGRDVYFDLKSESIADIALFDILPGESETVLKNIPVTKREDGYTFSGNSSTLLETSYSYEGEVKEGCLNLTISDVKLIGNILTASTSWKTIIPKSAETIKDPESGATPPQYYYFHKPARFVWNPAPSGPGMGLVPGSIQKVFDNIFHSFLKDLTFKENGDVIATYAAFPDTLDFVNQIVLGSGITNRPESDWKVSPPNMVSYCVDGKDLHVNLNVEMIIKEIENNKNKTRSAGLTRAETELLNKVGGQLKLIIRDNPKEPYNVSEKRRELYEGDIIVLIDKSQFEPLLPLLPGVKKLLSEEVLNNIVFGVTVSELIDALIDGLENAETFEIGMYLNKSTN